MYRSNKKAGFTLVELAIVLVIIGLLVGGVLVGADLIKAATMNKAIKQIADIDSGANTFRNKYNDLPGDLKNPASVFTSLSNITNASTATKGTGDGNGLIEAYLSATTTTATVGVAGEVGIFFAQMAAAGYIKEAISPGGALNMTFAALTAADFKTAFQPTALGKDSYFLASTGAISTTTNDGRNYILIVGDGALASGGVSVFSAALNPLEASNIDGKLDDGVPNTGNVISVDVAAPAATTSGMTAGQGGSALTGDCFNVTTYNSSLTSQECNLSIRASF